MRERFNSADTVGAALDQIPLILCNINKPMDRARNGARYFRNPPQPHMCIQDYIEGYDQLCFINVLSWVKISTPRRPEDPIPLYGGMRVPHSSSTALTLSNHKMPKHQPLLFAVMANPEILRLSGKTAQDPSDRDALVELMIDFVEAMNPDVKFKRQFEVLRDRDLAGELKDIWLAVQVKRERERGENGRRGDSDRGRENKEDHAWKEEVKHRGMKSEKREREREEISGMYLHEDYSNNRMEKFNNVNQDVEVPLLNDREQDRATKHVRLKKKESELLTSCYTRPSCETEKGSIYAKGTSSSSTTSNHRLTTPSTETVNTDDIKHHETAHIEEESKHTLTRSWDNESELEYKHGQTDDLVPSESPKQCFPVFSTAGAETSKRTDDKVTFPLFSEYSDKEQISLVGASSNSGNSGDVNASCLVVRCEHDYVMDHNYHNYKENNVAYKHEDVSPAILAFNDSTLSHVGNFSNDSKNKENIKEGALTSKHSYHVIKSNLKNTNLTATNNDSDSMEDQNILSNYVMESKIANSEAQVPNQADKSHEELLPNVNDNPIVKFTVGTGQDNIVIP